MDRRGGKGRKTNFVEACIVCVSCPPNWEEKRAGGGYRDISEEISRKSFVLIVEGVWLPTRASILGSKVPIGELETIPEPV